MAYYATDRVTQTVRSWSLHCLHDYITDRVTEIENKGQQERVTFCTKK